jgi:hypothetical protein
VGPALCHVLVARRDRVERAGTPGAGLLNALVRGCARAAGALAGPTGVDVVTQAMPDRDALHLGAALRLDHPSPEASAYALDGRVPVEAASRLFALTAAAGRRYTLDPAAVATDRFVE